MNFQTNTMLIIFGTILAVSVISLVILLVIRSKKMKAANNQLKNDISQNNANSMMPAVAPENSSSAMNMAMPGNTMQFTSNPFETNNNLDLNSQNLGNNLAATSGIPNEGIMQNPVPASNMQVASAITPTMSAAPVIPSMAPATQPMMSVDPVTLPTAVQPELSMPAAPAPVINPTPIVSEPVQAMAPSNFAMATPTVTPQATMPSIEPVMPTVPVSAPVVSMPAAPAPTIQEPAVMASTMNVSSVNGSGMDAAAQPVNPISVGVQDPAGIFTQQATATPVATNSTPEPTIAELPNVPEVQSEAAITDLTPDQNINTQPTTVPEMKLPDVSEIDLTPKVENTLPVQTPAVSAPVSAPVAPVSSMPTIQPQVAAAPTITSTPEIPATPNLNGLPPLNNLVNTPSQPVQTQAPVVESIPAAPQAAEVPVMTMNATTMAQPIAQAPISANLGMQPDPLLNQAQTAAPIMNTGVTPPQA